MALIGVLGRWLLRAVPLVFVVSALTFVLASLIPGDAALSIVGFDAQPAQYEAVRAQLGLDKPLWQRYWDWLFHAVQGDFGRSSMHQDLVSSQLKVRLGVTLSLIAGSLVVAAVVGIALGVLSALRRGAMGKSVDVLSLLGVAVPSYWLGMILAYVFAVRYHIVNATGYVGPTESLSGWLQTLFLPVVTLGFSASAPIAKQTRLGVLSELEKEYVTVLRARGVPERSIVLKHVLRNASAPVVTVLGLVVIGLLSGTVLVETLFVLPGLGGMAVLATRTHDIASIQGAAVVFTIIVVLVNLVIQLVHAALDPQVRR